MKMKKQKQIILKALIKHKFFSAKRNCELLFGQENDDSQFYNCEKPKKKKGKIRMDLKISRESHQKNKQIN